MVTKQNRIASITGKTILFSVVVLIALYLCRNPLLNFLVNNYAIQRIEKEIPGLTFSSISFSTNLYSTIQLNKLALQFKDDSGSVLMVRSPSIDFHFSFSDLFQGRQYTLQKGQLHINNSTISYEKGGAHGQKDERSVPLISFSASKSLPLVDISDTRLDITVNNKTYHFDDLNIQGVHQRNSEYSMEISASRYEQLEQEEVKRTFEGVKSSWQVSEDTLFLQSLFIENELLASDFLLSVKEKIKKLDGVLYLFHGQTKLNAQLIDNNLFLSFQSLVNEIADAHSAGITKFPVRGRLEAQGSAHLDINDLTIKKANIDLSMQDMQFSGSPSPPLSLSLRAVANADNQRLRIKNCEIKSRFGDLAKITADIDLKHKTIHDFDLQAQIKDIRAYSALPDSLQKKIPEHVTLNFIAKGPWNDLTGQGHFYMDNLAATTTDVKKLLVPFEVKNNELHIQSAKTDFIDGSTVTTSFSLNKNYNLKLDQFDIEYSGQRFSLGKPAVLAFDKKSIRIETPLLLSSSTGSISLEGLLSSGSASNFSAGIQLRSGNEVFKHFGLDRKLSMDSVAVNMTYSGTLDSPYFLITGNLTNTHDIDTGMTLSGEFNLSFKENNFHVERFSLDDKSGNQIFLHGDIPIRFEGIKPIASPGPLRLNANVELNKAHTLFYKLSGYITSGESLHLQSKITGTWQQPVGTLNIEAERLVPAENVTFLPPDPFNILCELQSKDKVLAVKSCQIFSEALDFNIKGKLSEIDAITNLFNSEKTRPKGEYDLRGSLVLTDASWAADKVDILRRVGGQLESSFSIKGPFSEPYIEAATVLTNGEVRSSLELPAIREIHLESFLSGTNLTIKNTRAVIGGEPVHGHGNLTISKDAVQVHDLNLTGKNLLFFRAEGIKVRGDAILNLQDTTGTPSLRGEIKLTDSKITKNINILSSLLSGITESSPAKSTHMFSIEEGYLKEAKLHIKVESENPIIFSNNLIKGKARPNLLVSGTGELPVVTGEIYIDPTTVKLPAGKLHIDDGLVSFLESAPERPIIMLNGNAKMKGYDITLQAEGPYDNPVVTLSSIPPLPNEELLLLVLTGKTPPSAGLNDSNNKSTVAVYLGRGLLTKLFGSESTDDESLLDRLELDIGKNITEQGDETIEAQFLLSDNFLRSNGSLFLTGGKDVWDDYNGGLRIVFNFR